MRILGVVSGKGGVGKTTTVTNLAVLLAQHHKRKVLAVDGNLLAPNLGLHFGVYQYGKTFTDVLLREASVEEAVQVHSSGVHILPATPAPYPVAAVGPALDPVLRQMKDYDYVLVDTAPGLERSVFPILEVSDEILVVTNPEYPSLIDAKRTIEMAKQSRVQIRGVELNRYRKERGSLSPVDVQYVCEVPVVSVVPDRPEVRRSISAGFPVVAGAPRSPAALEFRRLAAFLLGERYEEGLGEKLANLLWFRRRLSIESKLRKVPVPPLPPPREILEAGPPPAPAEKVLPLEEKPVPAVFPEAEKAKARLKAVKRGKGPTSQETMNLWREQEIVEAFLRGLEKQYKKGILPEFTYKKLKESNEAKLREIQERLEG